MIEFQDGILRISGGLSGVVMLLLLLFCFILGFFGEENIRDYYCRQIHKKISKTSLSLEYFTAEY